MRYAPERAQRSSVILFDSYTSFGKVKNNTNIYCPRSTPTTAATWVKRAPHLCNNRFFNRVCNSDVPPAADSAGDCLWFCSAATIARSNMAAVLLIWSPLLPSVEPPSPERGARRGNSRDDYFFLGFLGFLERDLALQSGQMGALRWICWWHDRHDFIGGGCCLQPRDTTLRQTYRYDIFPGAYTCRQFSDRQWLQWGYAKPVRYNRHGVGAICVAYRQSGAIVANQIK